MANVLTSHRLINLVNVPTHTSGYILDLVITDIEFHYIHNVTVEPYETISDHRVVYFELQKSLIDHKEKQILVRNYKMFKSEEFTNYLKNKYIDFTLGGLCIHSKVLSDCASCLVSFYRDTSEHFIDKNVSRREKTFKNSEKSKNKWYNSNPCIREAKKTLRKADKRMYSR